MSENGGRQGNFKEFLLAQREYDSITEWVDGPTYLRISGRLIAAARAAGSKDRNKA